MKKRPYILVTNDDGILAPGIQKLIQIMEKIGDVVVVAPDKPQSAMGHAITIHNTLEVKKITQSEGGTQQYSCTGTPVDCVKIAVNELLTHKPDLCVSGINHGSNASINVIYSGTMSAAVEAGIEGIPAIGFSIDDFTWDANFEFVAPFIEKITQNVLENSLPKGVVLNVNFPKEKPKGIKIARQAHAHWVEKFDKRINPMGKTYYWLTGEFVNLDKGEDTDQWALEHDYVSVVPVHYDMTAHYALQDLNNWNF